MGSMESTSISPSSNAVCVRPQSREDTSRCDAAGDLFAADSVQKTLGKDDGESISRVSNAERKPLRMCEDWTLSSGQ